MTAIPGEPHILEGNSLRGARPTQGLIQGDPGRHSGLHGADRLAGSDQVAHPRLGVLTLGDGTRLPGRHDGMGSFVAVYNVLGFRLVEPPLSVPPALAALAFTTPRRQASPVR